MSDAPPGIFQQGFYTATKVFSIDPHKDCTTLLGPIARNKRFIACYVPMTDEMYIPKDCAKSQSKTCKDLVKHEEGHARGWRHPND